jgi:enoyl-CoA hydratase/carnithine racemase
LKSMLIETALDGRLLRLTLNRPEKRNALNIDMCRAIVEAVHRADEDEAIGAVLIAGAGEAFCAGMDLTEAREADRGPLADAHEPLFTLAETVRKPIVAAVRGPAIAGGTGLAANAHVVVASENATFGLIEIRLALWPVLIFPAIAAAVGERRAVELALTGRVFGARDALSYGLASEVVADDQLESRAAAVAQALANSSGPTMSAGLDYVRGIRGKDAKQALQIGRAARDQIMQTEDFAEGLRAFREKRSPVWPSHKTSRVT